MNRITQDMRYRQSLLKYSEKYGVTKAAMNISMQLILFIPLRISKLNLPLIIATIIIFPCALLTGFLQKVLFFNFLRFGVTYP